ncbi:hypothetical protein F2P81_002999 [Scophthalmus maximus]|uniref:Uncharacterized protein n=1 Tax=Scophthalmus maximus TaxID=52904 RepID=A0A6A4TLZ2_SCOMX|nr:hypothetical protein F2P81_002999 [Scophthalmus maximus]
MRGMLVRCHGCRCHRANVEVDTSWIRFVCSAQFVENIDLLFVFRCVAQLTVEGLSFSIALHHVLVI